MKPFFRNFSSHFSLRFRGLFNAFYNPWISFSARFYFEFKFWKGVIIMCNGSVNCLHDSLRLSKPLTEPQVVSRNRCCCLWTFTTISLYKFSWWFSEFKDLLSTKAQVIGKWSAVSVIIITVLKSLRAQVTPKINLTEDQLNTTS